MDAQQFLAEFGHIANAPGGVARLRELVLALAVSGRLIERIEIKENLAADFLRKLEQELSDYKAANKYRRTSGDRDATSKLRIPAPAGWVNARLGQIGVLIRGVTYNKAVAHSANGQGMTGLLRATNIGANVSFDDLVYVPSDLVDKEQILCAGDVLIAMSSGSKDLVGKAAIVLEDSDFGFGAFCGAFRPMPSLRREFIRVVMQSPQYRNYVFGQGKGIGINNLTKGHIEDYEFFLPPPEEQSRIVAKVDELMALCDKLEAQQQARRKLQNNLRQSSLQAVASATSPHELQTTWTRLADNFGRLFHAPGDVKELRNLIFQLGIQGLLVDQFEVDQEMSIAFMRSVQEKKDRMVASGVIRRATSFPAVEESEVPFALPRGWRFCRLGEVSICRDGQRIPLSKAEREPRRGEFPYYGASGVIDHIDDFIFEEDLLLVGEDGANLVNRSTPIAFIATGRYWVNNHAHVLDTVDSTALRYLELFINAIDLKPYVTGTAQPKMNQEKMNLIVVALPPPKEQALIVERIDALMRFCDALENTLSDAVKTAERFAVSAVSSLTGIAIEQEEEPMKAPQTELIAPLRLGTVPDIKAQAPLATILARHNGEMAAKDLWQRFGGEIDAFYAQLKTEVAHGWILEPAVAEMREKQADAVSA